MALRRSGSSVARGRQLLPLSAFDTSSGKFGFGEMRKILYGC